MDDMLVQVMSNGVFKSAVHLVITNSEKERTSVVAFCHPEKLEKLDLIVEDEEIIKTAQMRNATEFRFGYKIVVDPTYRQSLESFNGTPNEALTGSDLVLTTPQWSNVLVHIGSFINLKTIAFFSFEPVPR
ncbi:uncharacterized protein LOC141626634 [Silene latifolia]|uniref:uncharacterized protein LOC141626634 n=1 Tax=Silene latifolia TaxID=37657 RepID=UPI003D77E5E4